VLYVKAKPWEKLKKQRIGKKYPFHQPIRRQHSDISKTVIYFNFEFVPEFIH
jgi:hypothetical protein